MSTDLVQTFMPYIVAILTLMFLGYTLWKDRQSVELDGLPLQLADAKSDAEELATHAKTAVMAAEQLYRSGGITRDQRWSEAVAYMRKFFPNLDSEILAKNLEASVLLVNQIVANLPKKENAP